MRRLATAVALALAIYAAAMALGGALYGTGVIGAGATHNDCVNFRESIAEEQGIDADDVPQSQIKAATQACLDRHSLTKWHAFRSEYLEWAAWPAVVTAAIYLLWSPWTAALHRQERSEQEGAS